MKILFIPSRTRVNATTVSLFLQVVIIHVQIFFLVENFADAQTSHFHTYIRVRDPKHLLLMNLIYWIK